MGDRAGALANGAPEERWRPSAGGNGARALRGGHLLISWVDVCVTHANWYCGTYEHPPRFQVRELVSSAT